MPKTARKKISKTSGTFSSSFIKKRKRQQRIDAIRRRLIRSNVNLKKPPSEMKSRIEGKVSDALQIETGSFQAVVWNDAGGRKIVFKRHNPSTFKEVRDNDNATPGEHLAAVLLVGQQPIADGLPARLVIELGENDSQQDVLNELNDIHPELAERVEFVGGISATTYSGWRKALEESSGERVNNAAYLQILGILDQAIQAENKTPVTLESVQGQINLLEQLKRQIPLAESTKRRGKDERNAALKQLQSRITPRQQQLSRDRVSLLREREQEIRDLGVAKRTPSEVMVHFLYRIREAHKADPDSEVLKTLEARVKAAILKHTMTLSSTQKLLQVANNTLKVNGQPELANLTKTLLFHLPATDDALSPTRLHDNIYGRVLDSAIVSGLVKKPPDGVKTSMHDAAEAMAASLRASNVSDANRNKIAEGMQEYLRDKDPRFWGPLVPSLKALMEADSPAAASKALLAFLDNPGDDGVALIAIPYVLVKTANIMQNQVKLDWMAKAGKNYWGVITKQTGRTDRPRLLDPQDPDNRIIGVTQAESEGAGITLRHQPNPFVADGMVPSMRPTLKNMPEFDQDLNFPSESAATALTHGLPFASGVSGSTNIMLHLLDHMRSQGNGKDVDVKNFLLGTMMFLVYDGGHSMQEVLWTANQLDKQLNLGLDLGNPEKANEFVADYERFVALFKDDATGPVLRDAVDGALDTTLNFFAERSVYSDQREDAVSPVSAADKVTSKVATSASPVQTNNVADLLAPANRPPPANPEFGDLSNPNPALYFKDNNQNGQNYRVDSLNPGEGWTKVEQFCSLLATHWLRKTPGKKLRFGFPSDANSSSDVVSLTDAEKTEAINTLITQSANGLAAQVQHAKTRLQATEKTLGQVNQKLLGNGYPPGTKIWFANDKHAQAMIVLPNNSYQVYNPDHEAPSKFSKEDFKNYIRGNNAFLIWEPPTGDALSVSSLTVDNTLSPAGVIPLPVSRDSNKTVADDALLTFTPAPDIVRVSTPPEPPESKSPTPPQPATTTARAPPEPIEPNPEVNAAAIPNPDVDAGIMSVQGFEQATSNTVNLRRTPEYKRTLAALEAYHAELDSVRNRAMFSQARLKRASQQKNQLLAQKFARQASRKRLLAVFPQLNRP